MGKPRKWQFFLVLGLFWMLLSLSFAVISYFVATENNSAATSWISFSLNLVKFFLWFAFVPLIFSVVRRFGFERGNGEVLFNFAVHIAVGFFLSGVHTIIYSTLVLLFEGFSRKVPTVATLFQEYFFFGNFFLNLLLYALIVFAIQAYLLYSKYLEEELRSSQLKEKLASAQLQALKMQLQPHFLFNALHSISSLNLSDPQKANRMISRLGEFLRMTLESSDEQMTTLHEETEYLRCYLEIEQIRFSDRLTVKFDIAPELRQAEIPHLILQPLVENAVKYGIAPFAAPGEIVVRAEKKDDRLMLQVADVCERTSENALTNRESSGKGLPNVRSRLEFLYGNDFRLEMKSEANGTTVEMEIPLTVETGIEIL